LSFHILSYNTHTQTFFSHLFYIIKKNNNIKHYNKIYTYICNFVPFST
jgi:hypothetical protein